MREEVAVVLVPMMVVEPLVHLPVVMVEVEVVLGLFLVLVVQVQQTPAVVVVVPTLVPVEQVGRG